MSERIVEMGLGRKVVEESRICDWYDPKRSFKRSTCNIECCGINPECRNYSPKKVHHTKNGSRIALNTNSFPDYLL